MSVFDDNITKNHPFEKCQKDIVDYLNMFFRGDVFCDKTSAPHTHHIPWMKDTVNQLLKNRHAILFFEYKIETREPVVEYLDQDRYRIKVICDIYPVDVNGVKWEDMNFWAMLLTQNACYKDEIPGYSVIKNIKLIEMEVKQRFI